MRVEVFDGPNGWCEACEARVTTNGEGGPCDHCGGPTRSAPAQPLLFRRGSRERREELAQLAADALDAGLRQTGDGWDLLDRDGKPATVISLEHLAQLTRIACEAARFVEAWGASEHADTSEEAALLGRAVDAWRGEEE
jgi:hypothetical protein